MEIAHTPAPPRILGVDIRRYKNLESVWLPWADGMALFGANGAGKTNLLEALAILLGTEGTVAGCRRRLVTPNADDLALVIEMPPSVLPWPPAAVTAWARAQ